MTAREFPSPPILTRRPATAPLTILYNGACPVCRTGIETYARADRRGPCRHDWIDIVDTPDALCRYGLDRDPVKRRLHAIDGDNCLHIGIDAFAALWQHSPGQGWLARTIRLPGLHAVAVFVYDRLLAPALFAWNARRGR